MTPALFRSRALPPGCGLLHVCSVIFQYLKIFCCSQYSLISLRELECLLNLDIDHNWSIYQHNHIPDSHPLSPPSPPPAPHIAPTAWLCLWSPDRGESNQDLEFLPNIKRWLITWESVNTSLQPWWMYNIHLLFIMHLLSRMLRHHSLKYLDQNRAVAAGSNNH